MSKLTTSLQAAVVIAAVAAPGSAEARPILDPLVAHAKPTPAATLAAPAPRPHVRATTLRSSTAFDWGDAALGAGTTLLILGAAGPGRTNLRTRRRVRPPRSQPAE